MRPGYNLDTNFKEEPQIPDQQLIITDEGYNEKKIHFTDLPNR